MGRQKQVFNSPLVTTTNTDMGAKRLELLTNGLKGHCSAIELRALAAKILSWHCYDVNHLFYGTATGTPVIIAQA